VRGSPRGKSVSIKPKAQAPSKTVIARLDLMTQYPLKAVDETSCLTRSGHGDRAAILDGQVNPGAEVCGQAGGACRSPCVSQDRRGRWYRASIATRTPTMIIMNGPERF
jgi:hypothetical protein